jgi:hypothetical protein
MSLRERQEVQALSREQHPQSVLAGAIMATLKTIEMRDGWVMFRVDPLSDANGTTIEQLYDNSHDYVMKRRGTRVRTVLPIVTVAIQF